MTHFSFWTVFWNADFFVKSIMLLLCSISIISWALILGKIAFLKRFERMAHNFQELFWQETMSLQDLYARFANPPRDPFSTAFRLALEHLPHPFPSKILEQENKAALKELLEEKLMALVTEKTLSLQSGLNTLASIASSAVFIGLLGTVWGIMTSFQAIAQSGNTNLAIVAPAISEALFATALGLFAAIPANFFYNRLLNMTERYRIRFEIFAGAMIHSLLAEIRPSQKRKQ